MRRTLILAALALASFAALSAAPRAAQADVFIRLPHFGLFIGDGYDHGYGHRDYRPRYYDRRDYRPRYYGYRDHYYAPRHHRRHYGPPPWRGPRYYDRRGYGRPWRGRGRHRW